MTFMANWTYNYFIGMLISIILTGVIIPKIILIAFRKKLFDEIDERKIHRGIVPRLGGIAFLPSIIFSFCVVIGFNLRTEELSLGEPLMMEMIPIFFLLCGLMLMYLVGIADDLFGVRYRGKFLLQIFTGTLLVAGGMWISDLYGFLWIHHCPDWLGWLFSIFLVIYVANSINLIDGIDGLASGLSMIALIFYSIVFFLAGEYLFALMAATTLGTLIPFFYYNVFGHAENHNKIFMGDTGSLTIGTVLAFLSIAMFRIPLGDIPGNQNPFILAIAPIILPCFDVVRVFVHRVRNGSNPFLPDKCHIHHKLLALGLVQWKALITILISDATIVGGNLLLSSLVQPTWLILGDIMAWTLLNFLLTHLIRCRERRLGIKLYN